MSMGNLRFVLDNKGKLDESELLHRRALGIREETFGPKHPQTLGFVNNLGRVLRLQKQLEEAEFLLRRASLVQSILMHSFL